MRLFICMFFGTLFMAFAAQASGAHLHAKKKPVVLLKMTDTLSCMARAIHAESRGEEFQARVEVGRVILRRVGKKRFAPTPCGVVKQKARSRHRKVVVCEFSWYCKAAPVIRVPLDAYKESIEAAKIALRTGPSNAMYFNSLGTCPVATSYQYDIDHLTFCVPASPDA